ncbi:CHAD domain-containing protein [Peptoniphilus olsenii]|uniref:CHAD domain-containing protein n=1 Tax=Peptoniphilus olsenii TaxID=411570 RepID=A0ABV2JBP8_9FIRM
MLLRLSLDDLTNFDKDTPEKIERKEKRIKALGLALPEGDKTLYYENSFIKEARKVSRLFGDTKMRAISKLTKIEPNSNIIIIDKPENLTKDLLEKTGEEVSFDKSMAVLSSVGESGKETVLWKLDSKKWIYFAYPKEEISKIRENEISLKDIIKPQIENSYNKIKKNLDYFIEKPDDIESVHKYRVSIRSFRALVSMLKPVMSKKAYRTVQNIFRDKAQDAARLRELDVLINRWEDIRNQDEINLLKALQKERKHEQQRLFRNLTNPRTKEEFVSGINLLLHELKKSKWKKIDGIKLLDNRLNSWYNYALESLWEMEKFNFPYVHKIRIKSKKYRYVAEYFDEYLTDEQSERYNLSKDRQKVLGQITDAIRNQEAVKELFPILSVNAFREAKKFIATERTREKELLESLELKKSR